MSSRSFSPNRQRPRITSASSATTISPFAPTAALVPRSTSATRSSLVPPRRPLSPPSREPIESYSLWQPILRASDQIVLYNPASHAINIVPASLSAVSAFSLPFTSGANSNPSSVCPYCHRPMENATHDFAHNGPHHLYNMPQIEMSPQYFQVLQDVNGGAISEGMYNPHRPSAAAQESFARFEDAPFEDSQSRRWSHVSINSDSDSDGPAGETRRTDSLRSLSGSSLASGDITGMSFGSSAVRLPSNSTGKASSGETVEATEPETGGTNTSKASSGYYATFFREETRLGMGANGSVFLCQHVLNGIPLGHFAVKKIAVGDSPSYLMEILRETRRADASLTWPILGALYSSAPLTFVHNFCATRSDCIQNYTTETSSPIITRGWSRPDSHPSVSLFRHSIISDWLRHVTTTLVFVPPLIAILRSPCSGSVLMQWAELGSLDDLILQRLGVKTADRDPDLSEPPSGEYQTREARIRAFRARAGGGPVHTSGEVRRKEARRRAREMKAVHLLSAEEIRSLFGDIVSGLAFLHESSFLHLDLKPGNVLLTLDEGQLMLSDFGTAQDALQSTRERSGNTGTLEYSAPESLRHNQDGSLRQITSKSDIWSLGMILHKLIYFRLPWKNDEDMTELEKEIIGFQGYKASMENIQAFEKRRLPPALCQLLSKMLAIEPVGRPGSDQVLKTIQSRQLDPSPNLEETNPHHQGMGPLVRRPTPPSRGNESLAASSDANVDNLDILSQDLSPHMPSAGGRGRVASGTQVRRRSDPVGGINEITPRLLVLEGPTPAARRVAGLLSNINVSRILSRGAWNVGHVDQTITLVIRASGFTPGVYVDRQSGVLMSEAEEIDDLELSDGGESVTPDSESSESGLKRFIYEPPPDGIGYGEPRLDRVPAKVVEGICAWSGLREIIVLRQTCKALDKAIANRPAIWTSLVEAHRRLPHRTIHLGSSPVVMPGVYHLTGFQEDILRCGLILKNKWHKPTFQARQATKDILRHDPCGIDQILFVPDTMGRFFLTISRTSVILWTLEPDGAPRRCRSIAMASGNEMIVQALVSRPGSSLVSYLALQITQPHTHRLRTEIYQLHLSRPGCIYDQGFGLSAIHETEGALVAFVDYVLAYAINDAGQTILLCCWVSKLATKLATPVSEYELRWQHSSCQTVDIGSDVIVVVRDSSAEIYPRNEFAVVDYDLRPTTNGHIIRGTLEMLPVTYATDTAIFPSSFLNPPSIYIHDRLSLSYGTDDMTRTVRVISLVGVARSTSPLTDPSIPYFVIPAQVYPWAHSSSRSTSPSHTAIPTSGHTTPSPTHTHNQLPRTHTPSPTHGHPLPSPNLPPAEKYRFVFHLHALQHQHPHFSYGPALVGPNGRSVMLATAVGANHGPNQPKQYVLKYRHPTHRELRQFIKERIHTSASPGADRLQQTVGHSGGQPQIEVNSQPPPSQHGHVQLPPPPSNPLLNQHTASRQGLQHGVLTLLTRPLPLLDILRGMSSLWQTQEMIGYEMIAWDEGAGTTLVASRLGEVIVLECAKPVSDPVGASSWHCN
ncbi:Kinase-like protein, partial [Rhizoctonia solani]